MIKVFFWPSGKDAQIVTCENKECAEMVAQALADRYGRATFDYNGWDHQHDAAKEPGAFNYIIRRTGDRGIWT